MSYNRIPRLVTNFVQYEKIELNHTDATVESYTSDIMMFFKFILMRDSELKKYDDISENDICDRITEDIICSVTREDIREFIYFLAEDRHGRSHEKGNAVSTRKRRLVSLKRFYDYLRDEDVIVSSPTDHIEMPKTESRLPVYFKEKEWKKLLETVVHNSPFPERDYCIVVFLLNLGLRRNELASLNVIDVDVNSKTIIIHHGKGRKERALPLTDACVAAYTDYLEVREKPADPEEKALFISKKGNRLSDSAIYRMIKKMCTIANLNPDFTTHSLRHTFGTNMARHGNMPELKALMGHESINTTARYTHTSNEDLIAMMDMNPAGKIKQSEF